MANGLGDLAQRVRRSVPGVQDAFGGSSMVLDSLYNRYVHPPLHGLADAARLTRDVARGEASMNDPATQQRAIGAGVNLATSMGGPAPEGALGVGMPMNFGEMNNEMLQAFHEAHVGKIMSAYNTIRMIEDYGRGIATSHPQWSEALSKLDRSGLMNLQDKYHKMLDSLLSARNMAREELRRRGLPWR